MIEFLEDSWWMILLGVVVYELVTRPTKQAAATSQPTTGNLPQRLAPGSGVTTTPAAGTARITLPRTGGGRTSNARFLNATAPILDGTTATWGDNQ